MLNEYQSALIFCATLLLLAPMVRSGMSSSKERSIIKEFDDGNAPPLSNDELSYALSDLSVDDLNALSQLMDALSEHEDHFSENDISGQLSSEELARFKRQSADTPTEEDQNPLPNVDEEYIRQLDDSFPNMIEPANPDKDKDHIRVKRK